ncbi:hypothetical protein DYBT9275_04359 [Dyadobacter sp. CECT 9275]|uniref:DUF2520 domain-containing protein n=2 Tax=Dyadobacter helix TaxID=2822344 RepID=A0A916JGJ5_9BACT|nr:hypothetical protein DYBT9275_04359 [Dyadobacter sp. CECT 9275]
MKISFVGSGNVAWHLTQAFEEAGHWICEVYSRDINNARALAGILYDTDVLTSLNFSESEAELIVIAVSDDALPSVMEQIVLPENVIVANTSGTKSLADLQNLLDIYSDVNVHAGIFYPLQTFSRNVPLDYQDLPFCIESRNAEVETTLVNLARTISSNVHKLNSYQRFVLHVGAVFASNFTNHLLSISHDLVTREGLDFDLLKPLIQATIEKALQADDPAPGQTGPARRGDWDITTRHLEYLEEINTSWAEIYDLLTEKIVARHNVK